MTQEVLQGAQGLLELAKNGATELVDEAIRLFMVLAVLDILKFASIFVMFYIVKKFLDTISSAADNEKTKRLVYSAKTLSLILSIWFFVAHSYGGLVELAKLTVAPNLVLMEKGYNVVKEIKK